jgi:3-phenylpropionate/trans-cinnamate dioxygenase ferredoxin subunit
MASGWHHCTSLNALKPNEIRALKVAGKDVVLCLVDGKLACFEDRCSHQDVKLSDFGEVYHGDLVCYAHGAKFAIPSGDPLCFPAECGLKTYPSKVENGEIWIKVDPT